MWIVLSVLGMAVAIIITRLVLLFYSGREQRRKQRLSKAWDYHEQRFEAGRPWFIRERGRR